MAQNLSPSSARRSLISNSKFEIRNLGLALALLLGLGQTAPAQQVRIPNLAAFWQGHQISLCSFSPGTTVAMNNCLIGPLFGGNLNGGLFVNFFFDDDGNVMGGAFYLTQWRGSRFKGAMFGVITKGTITQTMTGTTLDALQTLSMQFTAVGGVGTLANTAFSTGNLVATVFMSTTLSDMTGGLFPPQILAADGILGITTRNSTFGNFQFGSGGDDGD
jgi:hypothetical protein